MEIKKDRELTIPAWMVWAFMVGYLGMLFKVDTIPFTLFGILFIAGIFYLVFRLREHGSSK